ncbi:hypothetical protein M8494_10310 [Serratia ureilytica]
MQRTLDEYFPWRIGLNTRLRVNVQQRPGDGTGAAAAGHGWNMKTIILLSSSITVFDNGKLASVTGSNSFYDDSRGRRGFGSRITRNTAFGAAR